MIKKRKKEMTKEQALNILFMRKPNPIRLKNAKKVLKKYGWK